MNTKSKIFLALALVLSVTACSKGGGSHSTGPGPGPGPGPGNNYPAQTPENTLISINGGAGLADYQKGLYIAYTSADEPNQPEGYTNTKNLTDYQYIQLGTDAGAIRNIKIKSENKLDGESRLYKTKNGLGVIGTFNDKLFVASQFYNSSGGFGNPAGEYPGVAGKHHFTGKAFMFDSNKKKLDTVDASMTAIFQNAFHPDNGILGIVVTVKDGIIDSKNVAGYRTLFGGTSPPNYQTNDLHIISSDNPSLSSGGFIGGSFAGKEAKAFAGGIRSKDGYVHGVIAVERPEND